MNHLKIFIALFLALAVSLPMAKAQNSFDVNRMNRDLNIMENILQEMFKTQRSGSGSTYVLSSGSLFRSGNIRGTYLPDFGVIFLIPDSRSSFFSFASGDDHEATSLAFVYRGDSDNDTKVTEATITQRISEFLRDYGSTIGQLSADDKIMVLYGANRDRMRHEALVFSTSGAKSDEKDKINTLSVVVSKRDLDAYRSGRLSSADFDKKVSVSKVSNGDKKKLDMEVLANIFETAFRDPQDNSFRIHGNVNHLLLDNFGALFFFDAGYNRLGAPGAVFLRATSARKNAVSAEHRARVEVKNQIASKQEEVEKSEAEQKEDLKQAYSAFVTQLKEYLVDYGRTLSSVKSDQMVLLSVSLNRHFDNIPERIDVQVKKSALEAMDKGNASRDAVLNQVVVREY